MSITVTVDEAQARLKDLIRHLTPGEGILITENAHPIAKLVGEPSKRHTPRMPGNCTGMITLLVDDDEHLDGFESHMP